TTGRSAGASIPQVAVTPSEEKEDDARCESADGDQDDGGGCEFFGDDASREPEEEDGAGGNATSGELMGEETCMALFGENGVELLVDPSSAPAGTGTAASAGARKGGEKDEDSSAAKSTVEPPGPKQAGRPTTTVPAAPPAESGQAAANVRSTSTLTRPSSPPPPESAASTAVGSPGAPPPPPQASPHPPADSALMGEETCMALFGGDGGVELLVDPSSQPAAPDAPREASASASAVLSSASTAASGEADDLTGSTSTRRLSQPPPAKPGAPSDTERAASGTAGVQPALPPSAGGIGGGVAAADGAGGAAEVDRASGKSGTGTESPPLPRTGVLSVTRETETSRSDVEQKLPIPPATAGGGGGGGGVALTEAEPGAGNPSETRPRVAGSPGGPTGEPSSPTVTRRSGQEATTPGAARASPAAAEAPGGASGVTVGAAVEEAEKKVAAAVVAALPTPPDGGGAKAVASPPIAAVESAPHADGHGKGGVRKQDGDEETPPAPAPREEPPLRRSPAAPSSLEAPARTAPAPEPSLPLPAAAFKKGTLPTRARFGCPPSCSASAGLASSTLPPVGAEPSEPSGPGRSEETGQARVLPDSPSRERHRVSTTEAVSSSLGRGRVSSGGGGGGRSGSDPAGLVATAATEIVIHVGATGASERDAEAVQATPVHGVAIKAGGGSNGGGGGAVTPSAPPTPGQRATGDTAEASAGT
ncbi:unnamed protein product, partial [Scytosiphon promiscuus]